MVTTTLFRPHNLVLAILTGFLLFLAGFVFGASLPDDCQMPPHGPPAELPTPG